MKKILFIEDEPVLQKNLENIFQAEGYKTMGALDGEIGLKLAQAEKPDLILLDLVLPKLSGFDVLKKLKDNETTKDIPVIILTNLETMEDINKAIELGATTYLVKLNYNLKELLEKVKQTLKE
ncbi:response regulator [Candidatus Parcubacteria bacterium]|nr:response regulator [Candidatus Parcubacteria bacterium]